MVRSLSPAHESILTRWRLYPSHPIKNVKVMSEDGDFDAFVNDDDAVAMAVPVYFHSVYSNSGSLERRRFHL